MRCDTNKRYRPRFRVRKRDPKIETGEMKEKKKKKKKRKGKRELY